MKPSPLPHDISVVIPAFNRAKTIGRSVKSALGQGVREILVIDDGSEDDLDKALRFCHADIRLVRHRQRLGAAAARNTGIDQAAGDWIAFLDSDDQWKKDKIRHQSTFMRQENLDVSCTDATLIRSHVREPAQSHTRDHAQSHARESTARPYGVEMSLDNHIWGCFTCPGTTLLARKRSLEEIGGYNVTYERYEDWDMFLRLALNGRAKIGFLRGDWADIHCGDYPDPDLVEKSLRRLYQDHHQRIAAKSRRQKRYFLAALAFARASNEAHRLHYRGHYLAHYRNFARALLTSFFYAPFSNQAFRIIVQPVWRRYLRRFFRSFTKKSNSN